MVGRILTKEKGRLTLTHAELFKKLSADFEKMRLEKEIPEETFIGSSFGPHEDIIEWTIQKIIEYRGEAVLGSLAPLEEGPKFDDALALIGLTLCESFLNRQRESVSVSKVHTGD